MTFEEYVGILPKWHINESGKPVYIEKYEGWIFSGWTIDSNGMRTNGSLDKDRHLQLLYNRKLKIIFNATEEASLYLKYGDLI